MKILTTILASMALVSAVQAEGKHLFVLSGQSNMFHMKPSESFTPAVKKVFGEGKVTVTMTAKRGAAIRNWDKDYPWPEGKMVPQGRKRPGHVDKTREEFMADFGGLYDALLKRVKEKVEGETYDTVTFVWMQGESDSQKDSPDLYSDSFDRVVNRLKSDLGIKSMNVVIGRLSDYGGTDSEGWQKMRELQVKQAEAHDDWEWINTDDLNDLVKGGSTRNDLHYTKEGYKTLGERFAEKAIELVKKQTR